MHVFGALELEIRPDSGARILAAVASSFLKFLHRCLDFLSGSEFSSMAQYGTRCECDPMSDRWRVSPPHIGLDWSHPTTLAK
jgi:hypothetical protein